MGAVAEGVLGELRYHARVGWGFGSPNNLGFGRARLERTRILSLLKRLLRTQALYFLRNKANMRGYEKNASYTSCKEWRLWAIVHTLYQYILFSGRVPVHNSLHIP